jgi:hypothetical protein
MVKTGGSLKRYNFKNIKEFITDENIKNKSKKYINNRYFKRNECYRKTYQKFINENKYK